MNTKIKKKLSLLLAVFTVFSVFTIGLTAYGEDNVAINDINFPDATFRNIMMREFDQNGDGYLSIEERNVPFMSLSGLLDYDEEIKNLQGIEFFADSLNALYCAGIGLESLDVSALANLTSLTCQGNYLTSLDVSQNANLVSLDCSNNMLTALNFQNNAKLQQLLCYINNLESLNLSGAPNLTDLRCDQNKLTAIDVSALSNLSYFTCAYNHLSSLDLSSNANLSGVAGYQIGNQTVLAQAQIESGSLVVPVSVSDSGRITAALLANGQPATYQSSGFAANDVSEIDGGITYSYSVGKADCENLEVTVYVTRDFYQVNFYDSADMTNLIGKSFVNNGQAAAAPQVTPPTCKTFANWSEDINSITADKSVYALWNDAHSYALTAFDNYVAQITCTACQDSFSVNFKDCINKTQGEQGYYECLDVVNDGVINAKDYSQLIKNY